MNHPLSDRIVSILRTVVPSLWGSAILFLTASVTLPETLTEYLGSEATVAVVTAIVIGGWYALWRWLEPKIPAWLTRIVLGSNSTPSYPPQEPKAVAPIPAPEEYEDEQDVPPLSDAEIVALRLRAARNKIGQP